MSLMSRFLVIPYALTDFLQVRQQCATARRVLGTCPDSLSLPFSFLPLTSEQQAATASVHLRWLELNQIDTCMSLLMTLLNLPLSQCYSEKRLCRLIFYSLFFLFKDVEGLRQFLYC